jgi:hypothetical protein
VNKSTMENSLGFNYSFIVSLEGNDKHIQQLTWLIGYSDFNNLTAEKFMFITTYFFNLFSHSLHRRYQA